MNRQPERLRASDDTAESRLQADLTRLLFEQLPASLVITLLNALLVAIAMSLVTPDWGAWVWYGAMLLILMARGLLILGYRRAGPTRSDAAWRRRFTLGAAATGLAWGLSVFLLPPQVLTYQVFLGFVLSGMVAGAIPSLSAHLLAYLLYMLGALVPFGLRMLVLGEDLTYSFLILIVLFAIFMWLHTRRYHRTLRHALELGHANLDLVGSLTREKERIARLNATLEREIEERRATQEALIVAKEQAEAASVAKSQFVANMSHEIRTPMNGVLGTLEIVARGRLEPDDRALVELAQTSAVGLLSVIDDILDLAKIESGRIELEHQPFDLRQLAAEVSSLFAASARSKQLALTCMVSPDLDTRVAGDAHRLRQVLTNILGNAVKFSPAGEVWLRISACASDTRAICIEIQDTGIGMSPEQLQRLFVPFVQADGSISRRFGGSGLGLAISKQLVERMGGDIQVESRLGQGSRFVIHIPFERPARRLAGETAPPRPAGETVAAPPGGASADIPLDGRVLLAEDNLINQRVACGMLRKLGIEPDLVENGADAIAKLREEHYDAILMDVQMPVLDGLETTRAWRELEGREGRPRVPIIALTANAMSEDREICLAAGMDDYLAKPVKLAELRTTLERWLAPQPDVASHADLGPVG